MNSYKVTVNGRAYEVELLQKDGSAVKAMVNGREYTVNIDKTPTPTSKTNTHINKSVSIPNTETIKPQHDATLCSGEVAIKTPLPGTILSIAATPGQTVKKGERLLVLEAMKMENDILAEKDGKVVKVLVDKGETVQEGQTLMIIA